MRILFIDWPCFGKEYVKEALTQMGHEFVPFFHKGHQDRVNPVFDEAFHRFVGDMHYDCCFSFNYFPIVSNNCKDLGIKYISVIYDNPYMLVYSYTLINPNNYVFIFDKQEYLKLKKGGIPTVYHCTLPAHIFSVNHLIHNNPDSAKLSADVSFVGSLYNEDHNFFDRLKNLNSYTTGYLDGIMEAQLKIQGYNFIEEVLTPDIIKELMQSCPYTSDGSGAETLEYVYANYFIDRKLTAIERSRLLTSAATHCSLRIYTLDQKAVIPHAANLGPIDYYQEMPFVFANSKINLNITLRSIQSGIPLRAMDIMGAGGFLLTNFQEDFLDDFIPNEDFVYYESEDDLNFKIEYYLSHEKERIEITQNGYQKVATNHTFQKFFQDIFSIVFS